MKATVVTALVVVIMITRCAGCGRSVVLSPLEALEHNSPDWIVRPTSATPVTPGDAGPPPLPPTVPPSS